MYLYQPTKRDQSGFSIVEVLLVILVIAVLTVTGLVVYQHHKSSSAKNSAATKQTQPTTQPKDTTTTQPAQTTTTQYLDIKEWGVKLPLLNDIKDAYYVVPTGISDDSDGLPSGIILGLTSLNNSCGTVLPGNTGFDNSLGEIVRALPTDKDPVSGKLYTQLLPDGTTIGSYYYGYSSSIKSKTCAPQATLQSVDSDFATAVKGIVTATN